MRIDFELSMLAAAVVWSFVQLVGAAQAANVRYGARWAASPRDVEMPLKPIPGVPLVCSLFWNIASFGMLAVLAAPLVNH